MSKRKPLHPSIDHDRRVWFKRDVLVTNPYNKFENQKFGVALVDERGAGESYDAVYTRLEEAGCDILARRIFAYLNDRRDHHFFDKHPMEEIRRTYFL